MSDDTAKYEALAPITLRWMPRWVRENLSARAVWSILCLVFGAGVWVSGERSARMESQRTNIELREAQSNQVQAIEKLNDGVNGLRTQVAVVIQKVDDIGHRVDQQQDKWDKVEDTAERFTVPKVNKKHK